MDRLFFKYLAPLLAISIIPILAIVLILFFFIRNNITQLETNLIYQNSESLRKEISFKNEAIAKTEGMYMEHEVDRIGNKLNAMELDPDFIYSEDDDARDINAYAENIINHELSIIEISVVDKWGDILIQRLKSMTLETEEGANGNLKQVFAQIEKKVSYASEVEFSNTTQLPYMTIARPILDDAGNLLGGIIAKVDLGFVSDLVAMKQGVENGLLYIISDKGMLISHPSKKEFYQNPDYSKYEFIETILSRKNGTITHGENLVSFYTNEYGWATVIEIPLEQALASVEDNKRTISSFVSATLKSIAYFTVLIILFGLLLATIAAIFITKRVITPILHFTNATRRISEGEFSLKIEKKSEDEIGELTDSFNKMTEELKKEREELLKSNEYIKKQAQQVIEEHGLHLTDFTKANVNDLEKPLIMIKEYLAELQSEPSTSRIKKDSVKEAIENIDQIDVFLKDIFQHSQISTSVKTFQPVDFLEVFQNVVTWMQKEIQLSNASIKCKHLPRVRAIKSSITQLFQNLISNAIKYKSEKPLEIMVSCEDKETEWLFSFKDNGLGIDAKTRENIFTVAEEKQNGHLHYHFGLAMCKNIVERHGGLMWVESEPEIGSTFYFTIRKYE